MVKVNVIGGLIGIAGGIIMLIETFINLNRGEWGWHISLILAGLVIIGGLIGLKWVKAGGGTLLVMGIVLVLFGIIAFYATPNVDILPYTTIGAGIPFETIIVILGGIVVMLSSPE